MLLFDFVVNAKLLFLLFLLTYIGVRESKLINELMMKRQKEH